MIGCVSNTSQVFDSGMTAHSLTVTGGPLMHGGIIFFIKMEIHDICSKVTHL